MNVILAKYTPLFNKLSNLAMQDSLESWSSEKIFYKNINASKDDIPELIELATNIELFDSELEEEMWIPVHAWRILCELRSQTSVFNLIATFDYYYYCDYANDELPEVIASISNADCLEQLSLHIYDKSKNEYSRSMALRTINLIAYHNALSAKQSIDIFVKCLNASDENYIMLNTFLIDSLIDLKAISAIDDIRHAFDKNIVNMSFTGDIEDVEIALSLRTMRDTDPPEFLLSRDSNNENEFDVIYPKKIGRNDQCPCDSGKKYKKCCLDNEDNTVDASR